ncbi:MAG TPA: hypothetical protein VFQ61_17175 [Polyangiaceae bacterium]|nr:hypothetical protein [Polyangiaceae bacterium]
MSRALSRDPAQRYPSADAMRLALEGWLARSGPPVNERDLARVVRERRGGEIAARELKIRTLSEIACLPRGAHTGKTLEPIALGPEPVTWTERLAPRPRASRIWLLAGGAALFTLSLVIRARIVGSEAESAHAGTTSIRSDAAPPARDVRPAPPLALSAVPPPERNVTPPAGTEAEKPRSREAEKPSLKRAPQAVKASAATLRAPMPPKRESARPTPNPRTKPTLGPLEREL